jgi:cytoskeletal protein RodZ
MKTAGTILKETRLGQNLKLTRAAKVTKIRPVHLRALEADDYQRLPSFTSARGFLKNYAEFLGLNSAEVLAVFRRDFGDRKGQAVKADQDARVIKKRQFAWAPNLTTLLVIGLMGVIFIAYLVWQYFSLINAPYYE